jgi:hypothetical protein
MNLTIPQVRALRALYPQVVWTAGDIAYDVNKNEVAYNLETVNAKVTADQAAQAAAKQTALNKLMALGLTEAEALALGK